MRLIALVLTLLLTVSRSSALESYADVKAKAAGKATAALALKALEARGEPAPKVAPAPVLPPKIIVPPKVAPKALPAAPRADQHSHKCGACGATWWHGGTAHGDRISHLCPHCGKGPWFQIYQSTPPTITAPRLIQSMTIPADCPVGKA